LADEEADLISDALGDLLDGFVLIAIGAKELRRSARR
jgi:hypothetical protein